MAKAIGLTGGIGAGKSICARVFELLGIPIYNSDQAAKDLMTSDPILKKKLIELFGIEAFGPKGELNRAHLSQIIFKDKERLQQMNSLVHPAVGTDFLNWSEKNKHEPYLLYESAILIETGSYRLFDKIILVDAPVDLRIARVIKRDNTSLELIRQRIENQLDSSEKRKYADFVIENDGKRSIVLQILRIHKELLKG